MRTEEQYSQVLNQMWQYRELLERVVNAYDSNQFKPLDESIVEVRCVIGSVSRKPEFIPNSKLAGGMVPKDAIVLAHGGIGSKNLRCKNGHLATLENTYLSDGREMCRKCRVERILEAREQQSQPPVAIAAQTAVAPLSEPVVA